MYSHQHLFVLHAFLDFWRRLYSFYLMVGILLVPAAAALNARLGLSGAMASITMALAIMSAVGKSIGITRWLFAMPGLAQAYVSPGAYQPGIAQLYETLNAYAGGIGERAQKNAISYTLHWPQMFTRW